MKNKTMIYNTVFALATSFACLSCERKDLYYPSQSRLRVITHWENNTQERPLYNEAIFYPVNGGNECRYYIEKDTTILPLPVGRYHVIFYNWRTNANAQTVQFRDLETYKKMISFTGCLMNKPPYLDTFHLYLNPDMLYSWTTDEQKSSGIITCSSNTGDMQTLHIYPTRVTHNYDFHVEVIGLKYVRAVSAAALGFAPGLIMYDKRALGSDVGHKLDIRLTQSGFQCHFSAYNHYSPNNQRLLFVIKLPDGSIRQYYRDLNEELDNKGTIEHVQKIILDCDGFVNLPATGDNEGFEPPEINDWEGIVEDIVVPSGKARQINPKRIVCQFNMNE